MKHAAKASARSSRDTYVAQLNERRARAGRRVSSRYLDNYESVVGRVIEVRHKLAKQSSAYVSAARKLIP